MKPQNPKPATVRIIDGKIPFTIQALIAAKQDGKKQGIIKCPKCGGNLHYGKASNGHTRGKCETGNCISWIE